MLRALQSRRFYGKQLPFGHYLENREHFLKSLESSARQARISSHEDKLVNLLEAQQKQSNAFSSTPSNPSIKTMMDAGLHYGHLIKLLNPHMSPYILGSRGGIHIINLDKTLPMLRQACLALRDLTRRGARVVFVGTKPLAQRLTYECAMACEQYYVNTRWLGGTITNREYILGDKQIIPDVLVILDYVNNKIAVGEAVKGNIPTLAICDTNCDPRPITYPIPANDDCTASIELVGRTLAQAAWEGKRTFKPSENEHIIKSANDFFDMAQPDMPLGYSPPRIT